MEPQTLLSDEQIDEWAALHSMYELVPEIAAQAKQFNAYRRAGAGLVEEPALVTQLLTRPAFAGAQYIRDYIAALRAVAAALIVWKERMQKLSTPSDAMRYERDMLKRQNAALKQQVRIAAGMISTMPQFSDKHPEEALKFIQDAQLADGEGKS